jgi:hypothetical protein
MVRPLSLVLLVGVVLKLVVIAAAVGQVKSWQR